MSEAYGNLISYSADNDNNIGNDKFPEKRVELLSELFDMIKPDQNDAIQD